MFASERQRHGSERSSGTPTADEPSKERPRGLSVLPNQWLAPAVLAQNHDHHRRLASEVSQFDIGPEPNNLFGELRHRHDSLQQSEEQVEAERKAIKYNDGVFGRMSRSPIFENVTATIIALNAVEIGADADYAARVETDGNAYSGPIIFVVAELFFCLYFLVEVVIRFLGFRVRRLALMDGWFLFDVALVTEMLVESVVLPIFGGSGGTKNFTILRLLRLLRMLRMAKLMRAFPQLMLIVKGITAALRAVAWTAVLLVLITYTFSILFTNTYHQGWKSDEEVIDDGDAAALFFGSMGKSMLSLLVMGTVLDNVTACAVAILDSGRLEMLACFFIYVLLNSFTMMNMMVGILVEVVANTAAQERERLVEDGVKECIMTIFRRMDQDGSGMISRREFIEMKTDAKVMKALQELDIQEKEFDMYVELLYKPLENTAEEFDEVEIAFQELLDAICRLRPGAMVNKLDFAVFKEHVLHSQDIVDERMNQIEFLCSKIEPYCTVLLAQSAQPPQEQAPRQAVEVEAREPAPALSQPAETRRKISAPMLSALEYVDSADILKELQHRLGLPDLEETGVPLSMMDEELQRHFLAAEAFDSLGAPH